MSVVLDTSVFTAALIRSQFLADAEALIQHNYGDLWAPPFLRLEFHNTLLKLERRGLLEPEDAEAIRERFDGLDVAFLDDDNWSGRALAAARRFRQSGIYDAVFLACAEDLDADLWTCDARFVRSFGRQRPARLKLCPDDVTAPVP
ncbi:MAG: type II toxin-antitoxin system VapC family toxin [Dehalococcoidia bacterium]